LPLLLPCGSQISACILEELLFASMLAELITSPQWSNSDIIQTALVYPHTLVT